MTTPDMRASDGDRERVVALLGRAQAEGRLDLFEYDDRLRQAGQARTYGELARVTADLPAEHVATPAAGRRPALRGQAARRSGRARDQHAALAAWAFASSVNVVIWAVLCLTSISWVYPWWIWVAGPWGAVLLAGRVAERVAGASVR